MKMRRRVVAPIHLNEDAIEGADGGHTLIMQQHPAPPLKAHALTELP
jgi:hypothetical protein